MYTLPDWEQAAKELAIALCKTGKAPQIPNLQKLIKEYLLLLNELPNIDFKKMHDDLLKEKADAHQDKKYYDKLQRFLSKIQPVMLSKIESHRNTREKIVRHLTLIRTEQKYKKAILGAWQRFASTHLSWQMIMHWESKECVVYANMDIREKRKREEKDFTSSSANMSCLNKDGLSDSSGGKKQKV